MNTANYPDGETGASRPFTREGRCTNLECYLVDLRAQVAMYEELGATFFVNEDAKFCPHCGQERKFSE